MGELVLRGGRVIDPSQNLDGTADVVFADGRVKALGRDAPHGRDADPDSQGEHWCSHQRHDLRQTEGNRGDGRSRDDARDE